MKKLNALKIFIISFLYYVSVVFLNGFPLFGGLTVRVVVALISFVLIFLYWSRVELSKGAKVFFVYLVMIFLSNVLNGNAITGTFWKVQFSFHLVSLSAFFVYQILAYKKENIKIIVFSILCAYIMNLVLSYFQYGNNGIAWMIANIINKTSTDLYEGYENLDNFLGRAVVSGFLGTGVRNGYFVTVFYPIVTYFLWSKKVLVKFSGFCLLFVVVFFAFLLQQNAALLLCSCYCLYCLYTYNKKYLLLGGFGMCLYYFLYGGGFDNIELGRIGQSASFDDRTSLFKTFANFIQDPMVFIVGDYNLYMKTYPIIQHNAFFSSWVMGGFLAVIPFFLFHLRVVIETVPLILSKRHITNIETKLFAISCLLFMAYSMTHSTGLQSEGTFFWISYALFLKSKK